MFERKISDAKKAGETVRSWVNEEISSEELVIALIEQGALAEAEIRDAYVEEQSFEHDLVHIFLDDICVEVDCEGVLTIHTDI